MQPDFQSACDHFGMVWIKRLILFFLQSNEERYETISEIPIERFPLCNKNYQSYFTSMFHTFTPRKCQKTRGFFMLSGGIGIEH